MKKLTALILLLSMALFLFPACTPSVLPPQDVDTQKEQIAADFSKQGLGGVGKSSIHYFVTYNGYHIVAIEGHAPSLCTEEVAGYKFRYTQSFSLFAYKSGAFIDLDEAYEKGLINKKAIAEAHCVHAEQEREYLSHNLPPSFEVWYGSVDHFRIYNAENGRYIIFVQFEDAASDLTTKTIAGSEFAFAKDFSLYVFDYFGEGYIDLEEAYNNGLISKEAIAKAAELHAANKNATDE